MPRLAVRKNETNVAIAKFVGRSLRECEAAPDSKFGWPSVSPHVSHLDPEYKLLGNDSGSEADLYVVHDLYKWLNEATSYDTEADAVWQQYLADYPGQHDGEDGFWEPARNFPAWYGKYLDDQDDDPDCVMDAHVAGGIYGEGGGPIGEYTYNTENCLSSDIHYIYWEWQDMGGDDGYVVISFGGSHSILLRTSIDGNGTVGWFDYNRWSIMCDNPECRVIWSAGNGVEWNGGTVDEDEANRSKLLELRDYNAREGDAIDAAFLNATTGVLVGDERPWIVIEQHSRYPDEDTTVWCPHCGTGKLTPWFY